MHVEKEQTLFVTLHTKIYLIAMRFIRKSHLLFACLVRVRSDSGQDFRTQEDLYYESYVFGCTHTLNVHQNRSLL